jgi:hypothetical protein
MDAMMLVDGLMWPSGLTDSKYESNGSNILIQGNNRYECEPLVSLCGAQSVFTRSLTSIWIEINITITRVSDLVVSIRCIECIQLKRYQRLLQNPSR